MVIEVRESSNGVDLTHDVELGSVDSGNVSHGPQTSDFNHGRCSTVGESDHERARSSRGITILDVKDRAL